jgi:hypothetical protein
MLGVAITRRLRGRRVVLARLCLAVALSSLAGAGSIAASSTALAGDPCQPACCFTCPNYGGPSTLPPVASGAGSGAALVTYDNPFAGHIYLAARPYLILSAYSGGIFQSSQELPGNSFISSPVEQYSYGGLTDHVSYKFTLQACVSTCGPESLQSNPWSPPSGCPPPVPLLPPVCR